MLDVGSFAANKALLNPTKETVWAVTFPFLFALHYSLALLTKKQIAYLFAESRDLKSSYYMLLQRKLIPTRRCCLQMKAATEGKVGFALS